MDELFLKYMKGIIQNVPSDAALARIVLLKSKLIAAGVFNEGIAPSLPSLNAHKSLLPRGVPEIYAMLGPFWKYVLLAKALGLYKSSETIKGM